MPIRLVVLQSWTSIRDKFTFTNITERHTCSTHGRDRGEGEGVGGGGDGNGSDSESLIDGDTKASHSSTTTLCCSAGDDGIHGKGKSSQTELETESKEGQTREKEGRTKVHGNHFLSSGNFFTIHSAIHPSYFVSSFRRGKNHVTALLLPLQHSFRLFSRGKLNCSPGK